MTARARPRWLAIAWTWGIFLAAATLAAGVLVPPALVAEPADYDFSVERALDHIEAVALTPRPMGSAGNERAREEIQARLQSLGLEPSLQSIDVPDYFGSPGARVMAVNILARIPGESSTGAVALVGHYDTVPGTPGANDNASAVAILLEVVRAILAGSRLRNDVILLFTDGEEPAPRYGASAFVYEHPWADDIGFVINLEAIGSGGPSLLVSSFGPGRWIADQYLKSVPHPVALSFLTSTSQMIGGSNSDFATFRDAGISGVEMAYLHGSSIYHTEDDSIRHVSPRSLRQQGANALALTRSIANLDLTSPKEEGDPVLVMIGRSIVLRYPVRWSVLWVLISGAVLLVAGWRHRVSWQGLGRAGMTLVSTLLGTILVVMLWTLLARWRSSMRILESYAHLLLLVSVAAGIVAGLARLTRSTFRAGADAWGVLVVWWGLGLITSLFAPGLGHLFVLPALAGAFALVGRPRSKSGMWRRIAGWALVCATTLPVLIPAVDVFFQLAQPRPGNPDSQILLVMAVPALFAVLAIELLRAFRPLSSTHH